MKKTMIFIAGAAMVLLAGCTPNQSNLNTPATNNGNSSSSSSVSSNQENDTTNSSSTTTNQAAGNPATDDFAIDLTQAIELYREVYPNTDITNIEIDTSLGTYYYQFDGVDDETEYEVYISTEDGSTARQRQEPLDNDERGGVERREKAMTLDNLLPIEEINSVALNEANGTITEWNLEKELSTTYWEVSIRTDRGEVQISIDAQTGDVLEIDYDD